MSKIVIFIIVFTLLFTACAGIATRQNREPETEFGFITHMISHHLEAVDSARALLSIMPEEKIRNLLEGIIADQIREIGLMKSWLDQWYPGKNPTVVYKPMMRPLTGLSVEENSLRFLQDMIRHHEMAVAAAHNLLQKKLSSRPEVNVLAKQIIESQEKEITLMRSWLGNQAPATLVEPMDHSQH